MVFYSVHSSLERSMRFAVDGPWFNRDFESGIRHSQYWLYKNHGHHLQEQNAHRQPDPQSTPKDEVSPRHNVRELLHLHHVNFFYYCWCLAFFMLVQINCCFFFNHQRIVKREVYKNPVISQFSTLVVLCSRAPACRYTQSENPCATPWQAPRGLVVPPSTATRSAS